MRTDLYPQPWRHSGKDCFTPKLCNRIIRHLKEGWSLKHISENFKGMPSQWTINKWLANGAIPEHEVNDKNRHFWLFRQDYLHAREIQGECIYEDIIRIEDAIEDGSIGVREGKALIASKKWRISKMDSKRYAKESRKQVTHDGNVTYQVEVIRERIMKPVTPLEIEDADSQSTSDARIH